LIHFWFRLHVNYSAPSGFFIELFISKHDAMQIPLITVSAQYNFDFYSLYIAYKTIY